MQGINNRMKKSTFFTECSKDSWIEKQNPEDQNSRNKGIKAGVYQLAKK